jgi:prepilin-type N-terminal cleavage/methylation domain-containing protein
MLRRPKNQTAFTLIELLVVIAIIALLAALAIPAIQSANKRAWTAQDMAKLQQIGAACSLYANDNNGRLPNADIPIPGTSLATGQPDRFIWQEAVDRYLPPVAGFGAQSAYNFLRRGKIWTSKFAEPYPGWTSNPNYGSPPGPTAFGGSFVVNDNRWLGYMNRIPNPSQIVIAGEINDPTGLDPGQRPDFVGNKRSFYRVNRPGNTALYLFADFHIEQLVGDQSVPALQAAGKPNIWSWW